METSSRFVLGRPVLNGCVLAFGLAASAHASVLPAPALSGATDFDGWDDLSAASYAGYGGYFTAGDAWPAPMASLSAGSGDATFDKTTGTGYAASGSVYSPSGGGFAVTDATALGDLETVVFQIVMGLTPEAAPVLSINNGSETIALLGNQAGDEFYVGQVNTGEGLVDVYAQSQIYQWDLSAIEGPIDDFSIAFDVPAHAQIYAMRLDQSDSFASVVPEPAGLAGLLTLSLATLRRRRGQ